MKNMTSENVNQLTPSQSRAARALLAWSQQDLAKKANVAQSTVADFERGFRTPVANNADAMRVALERAGISFLSRGVIVGPLPTVIKTVQNTGGTPFRLINASDLARWATGNRKAQDIMPELLSRLIRAATGQSAHLCFPSGDSVQMPGWDGTCFVKQGTEHIPSGNSGWEIGTQREKITSKASGDYKTRIADPLGLEIKSTTFVFVTPQSWNGKEKWAEARRAECKWADVRAYDADNLVHWIELFPAVSHWLAVIMGKRPPGLRQLDEAWDEWSLSTKWQLSAELILAGRDTEATRILQWLHEDPSILVVRGESTEETIAFLYAAIQQLPPEYRAQYHSRSLIATTSDAARVLSNALSPMIIVLEDPLPGLAERLVKNGHHVYISCGSDFAAPMNALRLCKPSRDDIRLALGNMGVEEKQASDLARDSGRSLAVLRRLIPSASKPIPEWAEDKFSRSLIAALFAGAWDENCPNDKLILGCLASKEYDHITEDLAPWVGKFDSPISKSGSVWKIASPRDAWFLLARHISSADLNRFRSAIIEVLGTADPRLEMDADDRWLASVKGIRQQYSQPLRRGLIEALILLSVFGKQAPNIMRHSAVADDIVHKLFEKADKKKWWSLSKELPLLAEASPDAFLASLADTLDQASTPILVLFGEDGGIFGSEYLSGLLWALESLAWDPQYLGRVVSILAKLASLDPGGQYRNRPENSLRQIFLLWLPQTYASLSKRLIVLDRIREDQPDVAWQLMLKILPCAYDTSSYSPLPKWRELSVDQHEPESYELRQTGPEELTKRLFEDVGVSSKRWGDLLEILPQIAPEWRYRAIKCLSVVASEMENARARLEIWTAVREFLYRHRSLPGAEWGLPDKELNDIDKIYDVLEPNEIVEKSTWLFASGGMRLPRPVGGDWKATEIQSAKLRCKAIQELLAHDGVDAVFAFASCVEQPYLIGAALADADVAYDTMEDILDRSLKSTNQRDADISRSIVRISFQRHGKSWVSKLLKKAILEKWNAEPIVRIFCSLPGSRWVWEHVAKVGGEIESQYWKQIEPLWLDKESTADSIYAAEKLIKAGRARQALHLVSHPSNREQLPHLFLARLLAEAAIDPHRDMEGVNDVAMFQYDVEKMLNQLRNSSDVPEDQMAKLEWTFLPILQRRGQSSLALHKQLAANPQFFADVLCKMFNPEEKSGIKEDAPADPQHARRVVSRCFDLLQSWRCMPGTKSDNTIDSEELKKWVEDARVACHERGRGIIGDQQIGQILSASPPDDKDGIWPAVPIRDVIEATHSSAVELGFSIGTYNRRGVTSRGMLDGGSQERELAKKYYRYAELTALRWPRTSAVLKKIAMQYEEEAVQEDESAERIQW